MPDKSKLYIYIPDQSAAIPLYEEFRKHQYLPEVFHQEEDLIVGLEQINITLGETYEVLLVMVTEASLTGDNIIAKLRKSRFSKIPILAVTEKPSAQIELTAIRTGALDCIKLPIDFDLLDAKLNSIRNVQRAHNDIWKTKLTDQDNYSRLLDDLNLAHQIQIQTLPVSIRETNITIEGIYFPFQFLGGDLYYWMKVAKDKYSIILLDVMGHGVATSMICMYLRSLMPNLMTAFPEPTKLIQILNRKLIQFNNYLTNQEYHVTAINLLIDTHEGTLTYINAAHPYGIMIDSSKNIYKLDKGCLPLGIFDEIFIEEETLQYDNTANIFLYSDGIYELFEKNGLNIEYIINYVKYYGAQDIGATAMLGKLAALIEIMPRNDDISMVYLELMEDKNK